MAIGRVLVPCGISSAVFGTIFGSVFGFEHVLDPLYKALFGLEEKPIEVMESGTTVMILLAAVGIGVLLIAVSMLMNIRTCLKQRDYENGLFGANGVAGLVFYLSLIIGAACQIGLDIPLLNLPYVHAMYRAAGTADVFPRNTRPAGGARSGLEAEKMG